MAKITYEDKEFLNKNENIADKNKVNDTDLNEIKEVVNGNDDNIGNLSDLNTTDKSSLVGAINELTEKGVFNLWSGDVTSTNTAINLNDNYKNYDFIVVVSRNDYGATPKRLNRLYTLMIPVALLNAGGTYYYFSVGTNATQSIEFTAVNQITTRGGQSKYFPIVEVYGIKL